MNELVRRPQGNGCLINFFVVKILTFPGLRGVSHVNIKSVVFTITLCQQSLHFLLTYD